MRKVSIAKKKKKCPIRLSQKSLTPGIAVNWNKTSSGADRRLPAGQRPEVLRPLLTVDSQVHACFWVVAGGKSTFSCQSPHLPFLVCKICPMALLDNILQKRKQRKYVFPWLMLVIYHQISVCVAKTMPPLLPLLGQLTCVWGAARKGISHYSVHGELVKVWWRCQRGRTSGYKRSVCRCNNA